MLIFFGDAYFDESVSFFFFNISSANRPGLRRMQACHQFS